MTTDIEAEIAELERQEQDLLFRSFTPDDAWTLGNLLVELGRKAGLPLIVDIRRQSIVLFHVALEGSTPDIEEWIRRKAAVALRFESSTALVAARMRQHGIEPFAASDWLDANYAVAGGSFPVRVVGSGVVAVVTASGGTSEEDHMLVVEAISDFLLRSRAASALAG